jgi:hypothetical protein
MFFFGGGFHADETETKNKKGGVRFTRTPP